MTSKARTQSVRSVQGQLGALLLMTWLLIGVPVSASAQAGPNEPAPKSIWDPAGIQDFSLTDRTGEMVTKKTLLGRQWVAGFIFTRCKGPCPAVVGQMKILQERTGVTMVTFSVQPEVDTPAVLKNFATEYVPKTKPDVDGKVPYWYWLTGDRAMIYGLIGKSFKMPVAQVEGADAGSAVIHSNNLMHVDEEGRVLGKYNALEPAEMALLRRILEGKDPRGKMVTGSTSPPEGTPIEVEGGQAAGLTFTRSKSDEADQHAEDEAAPNQHGKDVPEWVRSLPALNASLNGLATVLLITGYVLIKQKHAHSHKVCMLASFGTSIVFLVFYAIYHVMIGGSKPFSGTGAIRILYFAILIPHIILAAAVPVLASMTIYRAYRGQWDRHKRIAKITFPIWVYVSITGVVIYFMLYHWPVPV